MKSRIRGASSLKGTGNVKYPHTQNLCQDIAKTCISISDAAAGEAEKQQQGNTESKNKSQPASVRSGNRLKPLITNLSAHWAAMLGRARSAIQLLQVGAQANFPMAPKTPTLHSALLREANPFSLTQLLPKPPTGNIHLPQSAQHFPLGAKKLPRARVQVRRPKAGTGALQDSKLLGISLSAQST